MTDSTQTVSEKSEHVNFLDFTSKCKDWRYKTYEQLSRGPHMSKTIRWIGTIDLEEVTEEAKTVTMMFLQLSPGGIGLESIGDAYYDRYEDGKRTTKGVTTLYDYAITHAEFKQELLKAKQEGFLHFHVCLEETVDSYGEHTVVLLSNREDTDEEPCRGLGSHKALIEESLEFYAKIAFGYVDEKTERITLLSHSDYHWHK